MVLVETSILSFASLLTELTLLEYCIHFFAGNDAAAPCTTDVSGDFTETPTSTSSISNNDKLKPSVDIEETETRGWSLVT